RRHLQRRRHGLHARLVHRLADDVVGFHKPHSTGRFDAVAKPADKPRRVWSRHTSAACLVLSALPRSMPGAGESSMRGTWTLGLALTLLACPAVPVIAAGESAP